MSKTRKENASRVGIETVVNVQILFCFYNDNHYPDQSLFFIIWPGPYSDHVMHACPSIEEVQVSVLKWAMDSTAVPVKTGKFLSENYYCIIVLLIVMLKYNSSADELNPSNEGFGYHIFS